MKNVLLPLAALTVLINCAHAIVITPDVSQLSREGVKPIDRNVGYCISESDMQLKVETPGGGGDKVAYQPYKELDPALFRVLSNLFRRTYRLNSPTDAESIKSKDITLVFVPVVTTDSSSHSAFTWPPTSFTVDLKCKAMDRDGKVIWEKEIKTEGKAVYDEFKTDLSLSAKRATLQAMQELQKALNEAPEFRN